MADQPEGHNELTTTGGAATVEYLDAEGVDYELVEHKPTMSAAEEARAADRPGHQVAKTVVLEDSGSYVLAVVPGDLRVDLHKVRELLGASGNLRLATEQEMAQEFPTHEVGAQPPFGPMLPKAELVDERLLREDRVLCAAGDHRHSVLLDPRDIVRITGAVSADICQD